MPSIILQKKRLIRMPELKQTLMEMLVRAEQWMDQKTGPG